MLDPGYKFAGLRSRKNVNLAKELVIQETVTANTEEEHQRETPSTTFETVWDAVLNEVGNLTALSRRKLINCIELNDYLKEKRVQDPASDPLQYRKREIKPSKHG